MPEWSIGAVSKTVDQLAGPRVRIPVSPPPNVNADIQTNVGVPLSGIGSYQRVLKKNIWQFDKFLYLCFKYDGMLFAVMFCISMLNN